MTLPSIDALIPHQPPMRLLDELCSYDDKSTSSRVRLTEASPFMREGRVAAVVALEYMAQCVAAHATLHPNAAENASTDLLEGSIELPRPRIGYLVGVRRLDLMVEHFEIGDELLVTVSHVWGGSEGAQFLGQVERNNVVAASATMTVFIPPVRHRGES